jgi:hypothetical protein
MSPSAASRERENKTPLSTSPSRQLRLDCPPAESYSDSRACTGWQYAGPATNFPPKPGHPFCRGTRGSPAQTAAFRPPPDMKLCNGRNTIWKTYLSQACLWIPMRIGETRRSTPWLLTSSTASESSNEQMPDTRSKEKAASRRTQAHGPGIARSSSTRSLRKVRE